MEIVTKLMAFIAEHSGIFGTLYVLIEFVLGKTELVKSGSVLEVVLRTLLSILAKLGIVSKDKAGI